MMHVRAWRPAMIAALSPLVLIPLVLCAAPAFAATGGDDAARQREVYFGDLDLSTAKGRHKLDQRLRETAATVCDYDATGTWELMDAQHRCYDTALQTAHVALAMKLSEARMASNR